MLITLKTAKNRTPSVSSTSVAFQTPVAFPWDDLENIAPKPKVICEISSNSKSKLYHLFNECFDSLPAVNTTSSLPITLDRKVSSFPNKRHSFLMYESKSPTTLRNRYYEDPYYNALERNPYPYGYEHEECFQKHNDKIYTSGTNIIPNVTESDKVIKHSRRKVIIGYVKKVNTYIVKSIFFDETDANSCVYTFFKQSQKLIYKNKEKIEWNASTELPEDFSDRIRKYLRENNTSLYNAIDCTPTTVSRYRTVLNNPFWSKTSAIYLLEASNKKLRKRALYSFRKNRYKDPLLSFNLDKPLEDFLRTVVVSHTTIPQLSIIYTKLLKHYSLGKSLETLKNIISYNTRIHKDSFFKTISDHLETLIQFNVDFKKEELLETTLKTLIDYSYLDVKGVTSLQQYFELVHDKSNNTFLKGISIHRDQFTIGDKVFTLQPHPKEMIKAHLNSDCERLSSYNIDHIVAPRILLNGFIVGHSPLDIMHYVSLTEMFEHEKLLVSKGAMLPIKYTPVVEVVNEEDLF